LFFGGTIRGAKFISGRLDFRVDGEIKEIIVISELFALSNK
jgi:hypothetical protein